MRIEQKFSEQTGSAWLITFKSKEEKREILNELRLTEDYLSESGKERLYTLIRNLSKRCVHDDRFCKKDEIATCVFDSDVHNVILFMSIFASAIKDQNKLYDKLNNAYIEQGALLQMCKDQLECCILRNKPLNLVD